MQQARILKARCENCGCKLQVKTHAADKRVACPKCGGPVVVSAAAAAVAPAEPPPYTFPCPNCGGRVETTRDLVGSTLVCRECGQQVFVPPPPATPRKEPAAARRGRWKAILLTLGTLAGLAVVGALGWQLWQFWQPTADEDALFRNWLQAMNELDDAHAGLSDSRAAEQARPRLHEKADAALALFKAVRQLPQRKQEQLAARYADPIKKSEAKHVAVADQFIRGDLAIFVSLAGTEVNGVRVDGPNAGDDLSVQELTR